MSRPRKPRMEVHFHGEREGGLWRGQVIGMDGAVKARTGHLCATQERAIEAVRALWLSLRKQLLEAEA